MTFCPSTSVIVTVDAFAATAAGVVAGLLVVVLAVVFPFILALAFAFVWLITPLTLGLLEVRVRLSCSIRTRLARVMISALLSKGTMFCSMQRAWRLVLAGRFNLTRGSRLLWRTTSKLLRESSCPSVRHLRQVEQAELGALTASPWKRSQSCCHVSFLSTPLQSVPKASQRFSSWNCSCCF